MGDYYWTGASSGAWDTAGNWSPSGPPGNDDNAVFDNVSTNLTSGPAVPASPDRIVLTSRYTGSWGASGAAIDSLSCDMLIIETSGPQVWYGNGSILRAKVYPRVTSANAVTFAGTSLGTLRIVSGQVAINSGSMGHLTVLQPMPDGAFIGPELIISAATTWSATNKLIVHGGRAQLYSGPTGTTDEFVHVCGGELWIRGGTIDHVFVDGGICRHDDGDIDTAYMQDGIWDATQSATARTLTKMYQFGGFSDFRNSASVGKPGTFIYLGGSTTLPEESYSL